MRHRHRAFSNTPHHQGTFFVSDELVNHMMVQLRRQISNNKGNNMIGDRRHQLASSRRFRLRLLPKAFARGSHASAADTAKSLITTECTGLHAESSAGVVATDIAPK